MGYIPPLELHVQDVDIMTNPVAIPDQIIQTPGHDARHSQVSLPHMQDQSQDAVSSIFNRLLDQPPISGNPDTFVSPSAPLGASLDAKLKAKIWANEFIDLAQLFGNGAMAPMYTLELITHNPRSPVSFTPSTTVRKINNFSQWLEVFLIYAAVLTEHYFSLGPHLFKYIHFMRSLKSNLKV